MISSKKFSIKDLIKKLGIAPTWFILILDVLCVIFSAYLATVLRENFQFPLHFSRNDYLLVPFIIAFTRIIFFILFKIHKIVVRYTNTKDVANIFLSCFLATITLGVVNIIFLSFTHRFLIPTSILIIEFFITTVLLVFYKFAFKMIYLETINPTKFKKNIIIFGAGNMGVNTKRSLDRDTGSKYNVLNFFDEDPNKIGKNFESLTVLPYAHLPEYLKKNNVSFLIIAIENLPPSKINDVTETALQYNTKVLMVPPFAKWINGILSFKQIKKVKIEDLLNRDPIHLDESLINGYLQNETILITGAAGSIGSEIVKQITNFKYKQLVLVDNAETPAFYLKHDFLNLSGVSNVVLIIADITNAVKMEEIIAHYQPGVIFHAAAYKHVPMMEENVGASIKVNVEGTKLLADLAVKYKAKKFVMISTDKAVNPSSVMGASKRIAEIYVQSINFFQNNTKFITTRFGNVLGSNGSVIPIFKKQIENGGPVIVTDPNITRFFMTIPEACQLVICAGALGEGGEIFIFDMGESIKVYDLAVKMIKLSGLTLGKDISIHFSGLRPGEKLYEELLANEENTIKTQHQKIMIAKVKPVPYTQIKEQIENLIENQNSDCYSIVNLMKEIVPEYKSKNSLFETQN